MATDPEEFLGLRNVVLQPTDDVQLWVVSEPGWKFPVHCTPSMVKETGVSYWMVKPGMNYAPDAKFRLARILSSFTRTSSKSFYVLSNDDLRKIATKADGITPEFYYSCPSGEEIEIPTTVSDGIETDEAILSKDMNKLAVFLHQKSPVVRPGVIRTVLSLIRIYGSEWMIEREQPLDLGCVKVTALPYRRHWKEILAARFGMAWLLSNVRHHGSVAELVQQAGIEPSFFSHDLIGMSDNRRTVRWTLEAQAGKNFINETKAIEEQFLSSDSESGYTRRWAARIRSRLGDIYATLGTWLEETADFRCVLRESLDRSGQIFDAKAISKRDLERLAEVDAIARLGTGDSRGKNARLQVVRKIPDEINPVPALPAVESANDDVRDGG